MKAGNLAKAKKMFAAFDDNWDSIEDLIKERSMEAYVAIESGMIEVEKALMPPQPNVDTVITRSRGHHGQVQPDRRADYEGSQGR